MFERDAHPEVAPRFNPDRSYTIDISGHGLRALRHIDACSYFDIVDIRLDPVTHQIKPSILDFSEKAHRPFFERG